MPYINIETIFANGDIRVEKCFSLRYGKKGKRGCNVSATGETQKKINQRRAAQRREDLIYNNFSEGDLWARLTYPPELRPAEFDDAHKTVMGFMKKIKRKYPDTMYMIKTETSVRGNHHHHMFFSWGDTLIKRKIVDAQTGKKHEIMIKPGASELKAMWREHIGVKPVRVGGGRVEEIYNFSNGALLAYFSKHMPKRNATEGTEAEYLPEKYSHSRNLKAPKVVRRIISNKSWRKTPVPRKGFEITDLWNGTDLTGFEKQTYFLRKRC